MAYHNIRITCKDNVIIPEEYKRTLNDFVSELYSNVTLIIEPTMILFHYPDWCWLYADDIEDLIEENKLTLGMIEAYQWLKENTDIESDCWNPCDNEYGPDCWDDVEWDLNLLSAKSKDTVKRLKESLQERDKK